MANVTRDSATNTLSTDELISDVLASYKTQFPILGSFATDFSTDEIRAGQTIIARILSNPSAATFGGDYSNSATDVATLTDDLPITVDQHKFVNVQLKYLDLIATKRDLYGEMVQGLAYALGSDLMAKVWDKITDANFSNKLVRDGVTGSGEVVDDEEHNFGMLVAARTRLNAQGANPNGRFGIVSSATMEKLLLDERIASNDYFGQRSGANGLGVLSNIAGFEAIYEYPVSSSDFANSENLVAFFGDKSAINIAARLPEDFTTQAARAGAPQIANSSIVQDADSGMPMRALTYMKQDSFDIITSIEHIYGIRAGKEGGSGDTGTDKGGVRIVTA